MADLFKGLVEASPAGAMASGVAGAGIPGFKDVSGLAKGLPGGLPGGIAGTGITGLAGTGITGLAGTGIPGLAGTGIPGLEGALPGNNQNKGDTNLIPSGNNDAPDNKIEKINPILNWLNDKSISATKFWINIFAPNELIDKENSRILLNVIMLYAINYIYKYDVKKYNYDTLKEIREYLNINKSILNEKISMLSKDYLDIVQDALDDIKLAGERDFTKQQDNDKMDNETKIADNDRTFNIVKLVVDNSSGLSGGLFTTITSAIANIWKVMMMWTKPFAGLVILVGFIAFIILVFFGEDDDTSSENSGGVGTGSLIGPSNFSIFSNTQGGRANNNTDIISVLQRLPQNIYAFFDKLSAAYSRFSKYANSSSDFLNSLSDTTPITEKRKEIPNNNTEGLYDNIYTFDYKYIDDINKGTTQTKIDEPDEPEKTAMLNKHTHVYNIKRPKKVGNPKISEYYGIPHEYKFEEGGTNNDEYIYAPKCGTNNNYVYDDCTVKILNCDTAGKEEDTSDYKNIKI
jgi:hypothetical protein